MSISKPIPMKPAAPMPPVETSTPPVSILKPVPARPDWDWPFDEDDVERPPLPPPNNEVQSILFS